MDGRFDELLEARVIWNSRRAARDPIIRARRTSHLRTREASTPVQSDTSKDDNRDLSLRAGLVNGEARSTAALFGV
jgi:hypothetical protein